jgi:hypothetical protein
MKKEPLLRIAKSACLSAFLGSLRAIQNDFYVGAVFGQFEIISFKNRNIIFFVKLQKKVLQFAREYFKNGRLQVIPNSVNGK